jgi:hypothetical protein
VQLLNSLTANAPSATNHGVSLGKPGLQAIVGVDHLLQTRRKFADEAMQFGANLTVVNSFDRVRRS